MRPLALILLLLSSAAAPAAAPEVTPSLSSTSTPEAADTRRQERRNLMRRHDERRPPPGHGLPPPPPHAFRQAPLPQDPQARQAERERLQQEVADLRLRLEEAGSTEAGRRRPTWWDLPSRRNQGMRLRHLRHLRRELDWRLDRLEQLREADPSPEPRPERKMQRR